MIDIEKRLNELNLEFKLLEKIKDGETSQTYIGKYKNKKVILKSFNFKEFHLKTNKYLNPTITNQLIKNNLFPKIIFLSKQHDLLIYEYINSNERLLLKSNFIKQLGVKLKKAHSIKLPNKYITFKAQLDNYERVLLDHPKKYAIKKAIKLFEDIIEDETDLVFSHNDLNSENILFNNNDIYFIDWEYASVNSRYCDLSKIINSYNLNNSEVNNLFVNYGLDTNDTTFKIISSWSLFDKYLGLVWSLVINKMHSNYFPISFIKHCEDKIEALEAKIRQ